MLKPTKMTRVLVAGTKDNLELTISTFHKLEVLHITDYNEADGDFKIGKPFKQASGYSELLLSLRAISNQLGVAEKEPASKQSSSELPSQINEKINKLQNDVSSRLEELRGIESKIKEKEDLISAVNPFFGLPLSLDAYRDYETLKVYTGFIDIDIEPQISKISNNYELFTGEYEKRKMFSLFIPKSFEDEVQKMFQEERSYIEIKPPELDGNPPVIIEKLTKEIADLKQRQTTLEAELDSINKEYSEFILAADEYLSIETQKAEAPLRFATSDNAFVIDGWVPSGKYSEIESELQKNTKNVYMTHLEEEINYEEIPIKLENPDPAKPFELLIDTFATPKYKEIDPSILVFITFPLFYGIMLGDIGYGLLIAAMAVVIKNKFKTGGLNALALMLLLSAILSILFGVIYGEFFGLPIFNVFVHGELEHGLLGIAAPEIAGIHLPIHRFDAVQPLLVVTLLIGILHIFLGLVLGFRNVASGHGTKHAIYEKGSWMMILIGGVAVVAKLMPAMMANLPVQSSDPIFAGGAGVAIVGIIFLIKGEGLISIMEIPTLLSNVLSYARILAIGLSSAGIALAVNTLSKDLFIMPKGEMLGGGIILALVGVVVLFIGHLINLALGIIGPGLHSLRLQYVEFFTKFYEGGGSKYIPFGYNRKYTEE